MAVATEVAVAKVISEDENDVGPLFPRSFKVMLVLSAPNTSTASMQGLEKPYR